MAAAQPVKILAVSSGKGGVGKTTVALNIARQLSLAGFRTLIVDFDIHNKGATCLFMDEVDQSQVQSITYVMSKCSNLQDSLQLAADFQILHLKHGDRLFLIPAARPDEMVKWESFVFEIPVIVEFLGAFIRAVAERNQIDVVLIDCYGGVDTLTLSAAGIGDDFIIINEPDVITFAGTLLLYKQLENTYEKAAQLPRIHFVINRVSGKYSFHFLQSEYHKHLARLAVDRTVLAYFPFDKLVFDTFGDYPFFSELLPKGLYAKKVCELIARLWPEPRFTRLTASSRRVRERIYQKTAENPFADPERIFQVWKLAPAWVLLPATMLVFLYLAPENRFSLFSFHLGPVKTLSFFTLRVIFYLSLLLALGAALVGILFEPFQVTRWLLRKASYEHHRRRLLSGRSLSALFRATWDRCASCLPAAISLTCFCAIAVAAWDLHLVPYFRNVRIWRGQIDGFYPKGNYNHLILANQAIVSPGTNISDGQLQNATLTQVLLPRVRLTRVNAKGASLDHAKLLGAEFEGADLNAANGENADFSGAHAANVKFQGANLIFASFWGADLRNANFKDAILYKTDFRQSDLRRADFSGAIIKDAIFDGAYLEGADFTKPNFNYLDRTEALNYLSLLVSQKARLTPDLEFRGLWWSIQQRRHREPNSFGDTSGQPWWLDWNPSQPAHLNDVILPNMRRLVRNWKKKSHDELKRENSRRSKNNDPVGPQTLLPLLQEPAETAEDFGNRSDLIELLLIRGSSGDFDAARAALRNMQRELSAGKPAADLKPADRVRHTGVVRLLTLLLSIISGTEDEKQNLAAWQQWLAAAEGRQLTLWEWNTWDDSFLARNYSREQNMKIRAIQLSSGATRDSRNNLKCDQMTLWFDSAQPCPEFVKNASRQ